MSDRGRTEPVQLRPGCGCTLELRPGPHGALRWVRVRACGVCYGNRWRPPVRRRRRIA